MSEPISEEDKEKISSLVKEAVGFNGDRGDSIVVTNGDFIEEMNLVSTKWYEESWFQNLIGQVSTVLILAIVTFGALKPLLNRILVPPLELVAEMDVNLILKQRSRCKWKSRGSLLRTFKQRIKT